MPASCSKPQMSRPAEFVKPALDPMVSGSTGHGLSWSRLLRNWRRRPWSEGQDVLLSGPDDGLLYFGIVVETDEDTLQCLVRFGDGTERWSPFYHLRRLGEPEEVIDLTLADETEDCPDEEDTLGPPKLVPQVLPATLSSSPLPAPPPDHDEANDLLPLKKPRLRPKNRPAPWPAHVLDARKALPYDFDRLKWDQNHARNDDQRYCYCGESGDWYRRMFQCAECRQWFHQECLRKSSPPVLLGDGFFEFECALCTGKPEEILERLDVSWAEALHLVLFNLTLANSKRYHDLDTAIIPLFRRKWKCLQGPGLCLKPGRIEHSFLHNVLRGHKARFKCGSEIKKRSTFWGLRKVLPPAVPNKLGGDGPFVNFKLNLEGLPRGKASKRHWAPQRSKAPTTRYPTPGERGRVVCPSSTIQRKRGRPARQTVETMDPDSDDTSSTTRGTLDSFIPPPKDFKGPNHPFRDLELESFNSARNKLGTNNEEDGTSVPTSSTHSSPSSLEPLEMYKSKRSHPHRNGNIGLLETIDNCVATNSATSSLSFPLAGLNGLGSNGNELARSLFAPQPALSNCLSVEGRSTASGPKFLTDLKLSLNSYFGAETRITKGERFNVNARRLTLDGDIQYLIEWEHPHPMSPTLESRHNSSSLANSDHQQSKFVSSNLRETLLQQQSAES
ncbi:hypothetical protein TCAL_13306 [Tigriopus californicus]|uniref:PHD-type domain-containing protein n=1 Tax=Tigriopus californicus TaxID=6832 RepID=A0A553P5P7_TIGCA|nr:PHD finger protein 1-like [Tigriopus californicus]TRY72982.1 hypothetical protein TCAL_13306 [Tigriopus californicus]|eukprot:TCALIF_13306-PA protein Name:"Similar to Phf19 PHD finger protein 19 (Mus musculus)" AED:0.00 eAED:0.00 QI:597/1/1/1/1/1/2/652/671